jgi:hypothetical protein
MDCSVLSACRSAGIEASQAWSASIGPARLAQRVGPDRGRDFGVRRYRVGCFEHSRSRCVLLTLFASTGRVRPAAHTTRVHLPRQADPDGIESCGEPIGTPARSGCEP